MAFQGFLPPDNQQITAILQEAERQISQYNFVDIHLLEKNARIGDRIVLFGDIDQLLRQALRLKEDPYNQGRYIHEFDSFANPIPVNFFTPLETPSYINLRPDMMGQFNLSLAGDGGISVREAPKKKAKQEEPEVNMMDSVIIDEAKKEEIHAAISQIKNNKLIFDDWGFSDVFEKGTAITLLFYGIAGTGKTLMAQAIAKELKAELKIYGVAEIQSSEPGGAERAIQKLFNEAREFFTNEKRQRVILFDECDSLLYDRNKVGVILGAQINAMLTEIEKHDGIIIFTTNRMGKLDPALERRISAKIEFPFPDKQQREAIWKRMIPQKAPIAKDVKFQELAKYPLAGGNIKNAVLNAARTAAYQESKELTMKHFQDAIEKESIAAQAFSAESEGYSSGELGDVLMEDKNKVVIGKENINIKRKMRMK